MVVVIALYYVGLVLVVVTAFVGMFFARREADRRWRRHQVMRPIAESFVRVQIELVDRLTPALRQMAVAIQEATPAFQRFALALRDAEEKAKP